MPRSLLVRLAHGSITKADTTAIVVSHFRGFTPQGAGAAVAAVDRALRGAVAQFMRNGILRGELGEFFAIPAFTGELAAQVAVVMGLGDFDVFVKKMRDQKYGRPELMQRITRELVQGLLAIGVPNAAITLFGAGGGGLDPEEAALGILSSFAEALVELDQHRRIHELIVAEIEGAKLERIRKGFERAAAALIPDVFVEIVDTQLPPADQPIPPARQMMYLKIRREADVLKYSIMEQRARAVMEPHRFDPRHVQELTSMLLRYGDRTWVQQVAAGSDQAVRQAVEDAGRDLGIALVPRSIMTQLRVLAEECNIILSLDRDLAAIPWELIYDDELGSFLCQQPIGRQVEYSNPRRLYEDARDDQIDMLLVVNPTGELEQAETEGRKLKELIDASLPTLSADFWERAEVPQDMSKSADIIRRLNSRKYEIVHYAGHADFDPVEPERSAWIVNHARRERIEAFRFQNMPRPPVLVFVNACESGQFQAPVGPAADDARRHNALISYGLAEAFISSDVNSYIGAIWKIDDRAASAFAQSVYRAMMQGQDLGAAIAQARAEILALFGWTEPTWASYVLYGSPSFRL